MQGMSQAGRYERERLCNRGGGSRSRSAMMPSARRSWSRSLGAPSDRRMACGVGLRSTAKLSDGDTSTPLARRSSVSSTGRQGPGRQIGRAHVCTPVTNAHLVCRLLLEKKKQKNKQLHNKQQTTRTNVDKK